MPAPEPTVGRNAIVILAVIAGGLTLYLLAGILTPLALAMFLAVMIDGFARVLEHRLPGVSRRAALPLAVLLSILLFGGTAVFVAMNGAGFVTQLVTYGPKLDAILFQVASAAHVNNPPTVLSIIRGLDASKYLGLAARAAQDFASTALFVLSTSPSSSLRATGGSARPSACSRCARNGRRRWWRSCASATGWSSICSSRPSPA